MLVYAPIMVVASSVGTWLFYVQHQYEDTYWISDEEWDYSLAALRGVILQTAHRPALVHGQHRFSSCAPPQPADS